MRYLRAVIRGVSLFLALVRVGGSVAIRRNDILQSLVEYSEGIRSTFKPDPGGLVPVQNASGGLLATTVDLAVQFSRGTQWVLIAEPSSAGEVVAQWVLEKYKRVLQVDDLDTLLNSSYSEMEPTFDLCEVSANLSHLGPVDVVISQSMLEHVVNPVQALTNLSSLLGDGGILVIQTCNPYITLHRYPIDCLRYFPDFFLNISLYTDLECLEVKVVHGSIYAVLKRNMLRDL